MATGTVDFPASVPEETRWLRALDSFFHYFFVARISSALVAWFVTLEARVSPYAGGPQSWMGLLIVYVYAPICLAFVVYSLFVLIKRRGMQRRLALNWVLFFVAIAAEMLYLRFEIVR